MFNRNKNIIYCVLLLFILSLLAVGCSPQNRPEQNDKQVQLGLLDYEIIEPSSPEFAELNQGDFKAWYEKNNCVKGVHSYTASDARYVLLSAGEKPTGGYYIENLTLVGTEKTINIEAKLHAPGKEEIVTMALTYPQILVRIEKDNRQIEFNDFLQEENDGNETRQDSGTFLGQIDRNSIEIQISGVPSEVSPIAFQLEEKLKDDFAQFGFQPGDQVIFIFIPQEEGQPIITQIEKIK